MEATWMVGQGLPPPEPNGNWGWPVRPETRTHRRRRLPAGLPPLPPRPPRAGRNPSSRDPEPQACRAVRPPSHHSGSVSRAAPMLVANPHANAVRDGHRGRYRHAAWLGDGVSPRRDGLGPALRADLLAREDAQQPDEQCVAAEVQCGWRPLSASVARTGEGFERIRSG